MQEVMARHADGNRWRGMLYLVIAGALLGGFAGPGAPDQAKADGAKVYAATCVTCHQANGLGKDTLYPPLAGSSWATGSDARLVRIILHGLTGEIDVEGETFSGLMPPWGPTLNDDEIAAVASYVRSSWGNKAPPVLPATVAKARTATANRKQAWTAKELLASGGQ